MAVVLAAALPGCLGSEDGGDTRGGARAGDPRVVAGVALLPVPAGVVRACRESQRDAHITLLCPSLLPRPSRGQSGSSAAAAAPFQVRPWPDGERPTGIDVSYSAESGRPRLDHPDRFLHLQVIEQDQRFPPGARPAELAGRRGALAPATSRGYGAGPYFSNHLRFLWREDGVDYAATLHNFGPATERVLEAIVAGLRPAAELTAPRSADPQRTRTIELPVDRPVAAAGDGDALWVAARDDRMARIDVATGDVAATVRRGRRVAWQSGLAVGAGAVWTTETGRDRDRVTMRVPIGGQVRAEIGVRATLTAVAVGEGAVWALDYGDPPGPSDRDGRRGAVLRLDRALGQVSARTAVGYAPAAIAVAAGSVWVTNNLGGTVSRIDAGRPREVARIAVGARPTGLAAGAGAVWVANEGDDTVSRIDPRTGTVTATVPVGRGPRDVAIGAGSVWVTNERDDTVSRIDPGRDRVAETVRVGGGPAGVAVAGGAVWVANQHDGTVSRISP